eukprot:gene411-444_t
MSNPSIAARSRRTLTNMIETESRNELKLDITDSFGPKFSTKPLEDEQHASPQPLEMKAIEKPTITRSALSPFGRISLEDLQTRKPPSAPVKKEDLSGVNPLSAFFSSAAAAGMSYVGWQVTVYLAAHFAVQFIDSDIYPLQRATVVARNVVVGMSALATGFCGVVGLGLFLLSGAAAINSLGIEFGAQRQNCKGNSDDDKATKK